MDKKAREPSKYSRKKKFTYSTSYQLWREAVLKEGAGSPKALALSCQHARAFNIAVEACV